jgi:hypothetical protein
LGDQPWITDGLSDDAIHDVLLGIAVQGNSARPIAARFQLHPSRVGRLFGLEDTRRKIKGFVTSHPKSLLMHCAWHHK